MMFASTWLWQTKGMTKLESPNPLTSRVINALYTETMILADEARSYFDNFGQPDRDHLTPIQRVSFSCESLKVTTRLMHVIAWLLTQRSLTSGEFDPTESLSPTLRLGDAAPSDTDVLDGLPTDARALVEASADLYARVRRLDADIASATPATNPALRLQKRLERSF
jgi:regulator of CtrA degradation